MAYWLASGRGGQKSGVIKRFAPAYWTVNFPRPMVASVVTTAPDALRVDAVFHGSGDLAGLIWEAEDKWSHPLLAYETARDFRHCRLRFRWRSGGVKPLDARHGPTLTIEGRDADGRARSWYVRLWNYAQGDAEDAAIDLDFGALKGGYALPEDADPVWAGDVDRMFLSLVAPGYDAGVTPFAHAQEGWAEMSGIRCDGSGSVLTVGDVMLPEHGLSIATGYDDGYNQTPERLVRQMQALGYRGDILHYVGMSHYFRLEAGDGGWIASLDGGAINAPCARWHADYAARARDMGFGIIWSLSYELLDAHCPEGWKQRAENGDPALTGWEPPSTLLSPANEEAMAYLWAVGRAFIAMGRNAGLVPKFQVGEPWWWIMPEDGRICLYDEAARAVFGGSPVSIADMRGPIDAEQAALLDEAGVVLAASTAALGEAVREEAPGTILHLLAYLPTILDPSAPEAKRANMPSGWAKPAFDVLQLEDYDWVTEGRGALTAAGVAAATARLGYAAEEQHYLSGFVLNGRDAQAHWPRIEAAARAGQARGVAATFIWALPQVARDGFTFFDLGEGEDMQAFDDVEFPLGIGREASVTPAFSTQTVESLSGHERRSSDWADARLRFDAGPGVRSEADLVTLIAFFRARRGAARGFRFTDPFDHQSAPMGEAVSAIDQPLGIGDGVTSRFRLAKYYGGGVDAQQRFITRPVAGSIRIAVDGIEQVAGWIHEGLGVIAFDTAPAEGAALRCGYRFDVPVRFAEDRLEISRATFAAGEAPSVPLVEIRE
ncbi:MAG: TIGR02217 family protein [Sphingomonadales bacterium]|nr:MAG: TIGR02217 family protein [Sphingomonadales bacterium]TNF02464.1 MAG: TIGR02217 family protein [Sphingomonadales bacterium]